MTYFVIKNLWFRYDENWILKNLSLEGDEGELLTIVGPSGCGKTTLLKILVGIITPKKGECFLGNSDLLNLPIEKRKIGYVPQNQALFPHLTVFDNIAFGLVPLGKSKTEIKDRVEELVHLGGLSSLFNRKPHELSGGQQQRVALLRAIAPSPRLLLLDEPLSNVDSQLREQLALYIRRLQQHYKITTIFVTHDLNEAKMISDKIIVLDGGQILQASTPMDISMNPDTSEVASTLGIKNLYSIKSVKKEENGFIVKTSIGALYLPSDVIPVNSSIQTYTGIYIDPTKVKIMERSINQDELHIKEGQVIASIPHPMENQLTLIVDIKGDNNSNKQYPGKLDLHGNPLRILVPIAKKSHRIGSYVQIEIPASSIRLFR